MEDKAPEDADGPLPGSVTAQLIQCGKAECRCRTGHLHGPYYYRVWRGEAGEVHKVYVKAADLERVRARCDRHRAIVQGLHASGLRAAGLRGQVARSRRLRGTLGLAVAAARAAQGASGDLGGWPEDGGPGDGEPLEEDE